MQPDLTISIINHSNPEMLRDCLRSIYAGTHAIAFDVWVVDNATGGRLVDDIRGEFPQVKWLFNQQRRGFSYNHNQVLGATDARYTCILNDDTLVRDGAMDELVRFMDENPRVGMAGPRLLNPDGTIQNSAFHDKSLLGELIDILLLPGFAEPVKRWGIDAAQFGEMPVCVDWILGACIAVRREALQQVGLLDDKLSPIANCEEVDWCRRARIINWDVAFVPSARVLHYGGQSMKQMRPGADGFRVEMHRAIIAYFQKHFGLARTLLLRTIYMATLPWNGFMLAQSVLRGRTNRIEAASAWATLLRIGGVAMRPGLPANGLPAVSAAAAPEPTVAA
jgi:GT2 family glycosyltransferase